MNEKFTKGPWIAYFNNRDYPYANIGYWEVYSKSEDRTLCYLYGAEDREAMANAALFAAAPDLYEALEWAYRVHGEHGGPLGLGAAMAAALKKARGT